MIVCSWRTRISFRIKEGGDQLNNLSEHLKGDEWMEALYLAVISDDFHTVNEVYKGMQKFHMRISLFILWLTKKRGKMSQVVIAYSDTVFCLRGTLNYGHSLPKSKAIYHNSCNVQLLPTI